MLRTVLIVDDKQVNREILKKILSAGYQTLEAADGIAAQALVLDHGREISAILLDLHMPKMDGYALLEWLRQRPETARLPVIVMTGENNESAELRAFRCGATDFLSTPYRPQVILARLENVIRLEETRALVDRVERDSLTGLYNREGFCEQLSRLLEEQPDTPVDLVVMDIGNFKIVNDLYGEDAGDELLRAAAENAVQSFAPRDALLGRRAGDQFLLAFPGGVSGKWLEQQVSTWVCPMGLNLPLRFGIYHIRDRQEPVSVMCDNAKMAADAIRGRYDRHHAEYDPALRRRLVLDQSLSGDMEQGLESDQFEAWYQPKCDPATGRVVGAEALVRWNHPSWGVISPDQFVPQFEKNRLIVKLDRFMWERAWRDMSTWQGLGNPVVPVSVNVSRVDVHQKDLVRRLERLLRRLDIDPKLVPLEITESAYTTDAKQLAKTVRDLRAVGFRVEMDDFGSGWSSLNVLSELQLDGVKMDMKFLTHLEEDPRNQKLLRHLLAMIADLGLEVTAEGVETAAQADFLKECGCRSAQGMYFAPALPRERFETFLLEHV